jgi:hypothetical protein
MTFCDWFRMMWTFKNLMWNFDFGTCVPKLTFMYGKSCYVHQWWKLEILCKRGSSGCKVKAVSSFA